MTELLLPQSGGYIQTFNKYMSDIESHTHYDSGDVNGHKFSDPSDDGFKAIFKKTTLNEKETYKLYDLAGLIESFQHYVYKFSTTYKHYCIVERNNL
jgi:hypothetical protein